MSVLELICQAEARRQDLQARAGQLTPRERADLANLPGVLDALWKKRRCEISGATMVEPPSYKADRAGLRSTGIAVTHATAPRRVLLAIEGDDL